LSSSRWEESRDRKASSLFMVSRGGIPFGICCWLGRMKQLKYAESAVDKEEAAVEILWYTWLHEPLMLLIDCRQIHSSNLCITESREISTVPKPLALHKYQFVLNWTGQARTSQK
jgi:hypothetical protein